MSDFVHGIIAGVLSFMIVVCLIMIFVNASQKSIAASCQVSGSFVVGGKAYKCELMK
jgi:hypothetical protein